MPLTKLTFKPGVNRENTRYTNEGGWYESDKVRFRQGTPEKIGGWQRISTDQYLGVCRSLWNWTTLSNFNLLGVGTDQKFYLELGGAYNDITPLRTTNTLGVTPFTTNTATNTGSTTTVIVTDSTGGFTNNSYVGFTGNITVNGVVISTTSSPGNYKLTYLTSTTYSITVPGTATSTGAGGATGILAYYEIDTGSDIATPVTGWGASSWGLGPWSIGEFGTNPIRIWNQANFGQNLVYGPRGGALYYWDASLGVTSRGVLVSSLAGASDVPLYQTVLLVSDTSRFVFVMGTNELGSSVYDAMLIRWSNQESVTMWTPAATNQAGSIRLSHGSKIVTAIQSRQEILTFTDSSLYSLQYVGAPIVWSSQLLADNISIISSNAVAVANGAAYWMGVDKFYKYDGRMQTLKCDLKQFIFSNINQLQAEQVFSGTNEGFNEVWWFYCSANSDTIDRYVVYNYSEEVWYYGSMARTAWIDSGLRDYPTAATYSRNLVNHEQGVDDNEGGTSLPITAYITSAEFDINDGYTFGFIWRILPDITFRGSTSSAPIASLTLYPLQNSGSGYNVPPSVGGTNSGSITGGVMIPVEQFTGQVNTRVRGRQLAIKVQSDTVGTTWQLGSPRIDIKSDGRR